MIKKVFIACLLLVFVLDSNANTNKIALELARAKEIDKVVKRINNIYEFINIYIMQTGRVTKIIDGDESNTSIDFSSLSDKYNGIVNNGYLSNDTIDFTIDGNIVTFTGFVSGDFSKNRILSGVLEHNVYLHENAIVVRTKNDDNSYTYTLTITLQAKSIAFLNTGKLINEYLKTDVNDGSNNANLVISDSIPTCNTARLGTMWYLPDGRGDYFVNFCTSSGNWEFLTNKIEIAIIKESDTALKKLKPIAGTVGYAYNSANQKYEQYVYGGDTGSLTDWKKVETN